MEVQFKQEMLMHMSGTKQHVLKHRFTIECVGHKGHGVVFFREIVTPKISEFEFGKAKAYFYMDKKDAKTYRSIKWLFKSEGLTFP